MYFIILRDEKKVGHDYSIESCQGQEALEDHVRIAKENDKEIVKVIKGEEVKVSVRTVVEFS